MRQWYSFLLLLFFLNTAPALFAGDPGIYRGFIVTRNGISLTGHVAGLGYSGSRVYVQYINDMGSFYRIWPQMISGFVYQDLQGSVIFESWHNKKRWRFLQVLYKGEAMSLYVEPPIILASAEGYGQSVIETVPLYFLELNGRLEKVVSTNFRKTMQRLMQQRAPHLIAKIGTPGYRFRDLGAIVKEYNDYCRNNRFLL